MLESGKYSNLLDSISSHLQPADPNIMNRRPRNPKQGILTRESVFVITYQALTMGIIAFVAYVWMLIHDGAFETGADVDRDARAQTLAFVGLTFCQLFQAFLSRSTEMSVFRTGFFGNRYMVGGVTFSVSVLMLAVYVPGIHWRDVNYIEVKPLQSFFTLP